MTAFGVPRFARTYPFTVGLTVFLALGSVVSWIVGGIVNGTASSEILPHSVGAFVVTAVAIAFIVPAAERAMGWWRAAVVYVVAGVGGFLVGWLVVQASYAAGIVWTIDVETLAILDPVAALAGVALAASAFSGPLWRRRVRILGLGGLALVLLYAGGPGDLVRTMSALVGLGLGLLFVRRSRSRSGRAVGSGSRHELRTLLGGSVIALAFSPLLSFFVRAPHGPLHVLPRLLFTGETPAGEAACPVDLGVACRISAEGLHGPAGVLLALLPIVVLGVAGFGILRGRRVAALIGAGMTGLLALFQFSYFAAKHFFATTSTGDLRALRGEETVGAVVAVAVPLIVTAALLLSLRQFPVRSEGMARRWMYVVLGALAGTALVFVVGSVLVRDQYEPDASVAELLSLLPDRYVPLGFLHWGLYDLYPEGPAAEILYSWTGPVFWAVVVIATVALMRRRAEGRSTTAQSQVREQLRRGGPGALSFMTTWQGNAYWTSKDGSAVIAHRDAGGVSIALGAPIGAPESRAAAVREFIEWEMARGNTPAFYAIDDDDRAVFTELGWQLLVIGEEARVDARGFSLEGGRWKDIRTSLNRARRTGTEARWSTWSDLSVGIRNQITDISEEWLAGKDIPEMGYTLGGLDEVRDSEVRLMVAVDAQGRVSAVTSWLPTYAAGRVRGWTLDMMRRRQGSPNGEMEMLIAETILRAQREGVEFVSLSAAPLSRIAPGTPGSESAARLLEGLGSRLERLYHFTSLLKYKLKFSPELRPLYLAYPDPVSIPAVGIALVRAYLPSLTTRQLLSMTRELAAPRGDVTEKSEKSDKSDKSDTATSAAPGG